jgi:DNA-binding transcriptional ArsR family regulator
MRPLVHPAADEITVQGILNALSNPVRAAIFFQLLSATCAMNCSAFANVGTSSLPKSTLSLHFKILREAGLIRSEKRGVELQNEARAELKERFGPLIKAIFDAYEEELKALSKLGKS